MKKLNWASVQWMFDHNVYGNNVKQHWLKSILKSRFLGDCVLYPYYRWSSGHNNYAFLGLFIYIKKIWRLAIIVYAVFSALMLRLWSFNPLQLMLTNIYIW